MPPAFLAPPVDFVGREEFLARFKSRVDHYNLFVYEGIAGIGKTALVRRLAKETRSVGVKTSLYLPLVPGEGIGSILARVEARTRGKSVTGGERQGDPFGRLVELLVGQRLVLVLDDLQHFRREELPALVRALRAAKGPFRVLSTMRGDLEMSAMDIMLLHQERVGPLGSEEVRKFAHARRLPAAYTEALRVDAMRGGASAHPLTLRYLLALCSDAPIPAAVLEGQSARSVNAFRAVFAHAETRLSPGERHALTRLGSLGQPITRKAAGAVFGVAVTKLVNRGLVEEIEGDVYVHTLVAQQTTTPVELSGKEATAVAQHLRERAKDRSEPLSLIRAGKLLAQAGKLEGAIATLAEGWDAVRDLGFLEAYLKILASIPASGALGPRVALLSARARMRQGSPVQVREEMERLASARDVWTRERALASLTYIYNQQHEPKKVCLAFESLRKLTHSAELLLEAGSLAAAAMLRIGKIADAEKLARVMLARIRGTVQAERQGELHRLLSQVYAQMGSIEKAVDEATQAAKCFTASGDLYHAATAYGFIGDMHREGGDFEAAQAAYARFHELAQKWGDRNLIQIAELTEAWVALDMGDMTSAQKRITAVEKELSTSASRRLRRYLSAARALLEAGRGHHEVAVELLPKVIDAWDVSGQRAIAATLRSQLVRSLIAVGRIDEATRIVDEVLAEVDIKTQAPRAAAFLRESALLRLRRKDTKRAMAELGQACKLFAQGGNRREEAHTLYRIAHAALDEGDLALAKSSGDEALTLARKIKHPRVEALTRELQGRIAVIEGDSKQAVAAAREAQAALKRLGDEIGSLHVTESLVVAQILSGDLASAIRNGSKLSEQAEVLQVRDLRIRAIALTGVALLRRGRADAAVRCFREIPDQAIAPWTSALMWRLGEALARGGADAREALVRREHWLSSLKRLPEVRQAWALKALEQLGLPPRERFRVQAPAGVTVLSHEQVAWLDPTDYAVFLDVSDGRGMIDGKPCTVGSDDARRVLAALVLAPPGKTPHAQLLVALDGEEAGREARLRSALKDLGRVLRGKALSLEVKGEAVKLSLPKSSLVIVPLAAAAQEVSNEQKKVLKLVRKLGKAPLAALESKLGLSRIVVRREIEALLRAGLLEAVSSGRTLTYRLA